MEELKDILVNVGAIAGVAAIVGLAVLAMLYFSQARDVRRLREWAGREPERAAEVELRAAQIASQAIAEAYESMALRQSEADAAAQIAREQGVEIGDGVIVVEPPPPPAGSTAEHPEPVVSGMEGAVDDPEHLEEVARQEEAAPAESGWPEGAGEEHPEPVVSGMEGAVDDPEHLEEVARQEEIERREEAASPEAAPAEPGQPEVEPVMWTAERPAATVNGEVEEGVAAVPEPTAAAAGERAESVPPPMTVGSTDEAGAVRPSRLAPSTPAAVRGQIPLPPLPPLDTSEFLAVNRPVPSIPADYQTFAESSGAARFESGGRPPERPSRLPMVVAGLLVALFAIVLVATQLTGEDPSTDDRAARREARDQRTKITSKRDPQVNRPAVTVSVLNGTQTTGLASLVGDQLKAAGFTETTTGNRGDGTIHTTSTVYYAKGNKLEAEEVAKELKIEGVKEIDDETSAAGGSAPVVVVLGTDIEQ